MLAKAHGIHTSVFHQIGREMRSHVGSMMHGRLWSISGCPDNAFESLTVRAHAPAEKSTPVFLVTPPLKSTLPGVCL